METRNNKQYRCMPFLVIFGFMIFVCHTLFQNRLIERSLGLMSLGSLFVPIYEILFDIIIEKF